MYLSTMLIPNLHTDGAKEGGEKKEPKTKKRSKPEATSD